MSVTLYIQNPANGEVTPAGCRHKIVNHLVTVCDEDEAGLRQIGYTDPPARRAVTPVPVVRRSPTITKEAEEDED